MRRHAAWVVAAVLVPAGLAANLLTPEQQACAAGVLDCRPERTVTVADGTFRGSMDVQVKGSGSEFQSNQTLSGPIELEIADQQAQGTVVVAYTVKIDLLGMDAYGTLDRSRGTIDVAGPARLLERIRGSGPLGGGTGVAVTPEGRRTGAATHQKGEIFLAIRQAGCGFISGVVNDGSVKDMRDSAAGLGGAPSVTSQWRADVEGRSESHERYVASLVADAPRGAPTDAKLQALRTAERALTANSTRPGDYFDCLAQEIRMAKVLLFLRRLEVELEAFPPGQSRIPLPQLLGLLEQVVRTAKAAVLAGADEECIMGALNTQLAPKLGEHLSREFKAATNIKSLIRLAQLAQAIGVWDKGLNDDFHSVLDRQM